MDPDDGWEDEEWIVFDPDIEFEWELGPETEIVWSPWTGPETNQ